MSIPDNFPISEYYRIIPIFPMSRDRKVGIFQYNYMGIPNSEWFDIDIYWDRPHTDAFADIEWASFDDKDPHASFAFHLHIVPILKQKRAWIPSLDMWAPILSMSRLAELHTNAFLLERTHRM